MERPTGPKADTYVFPNVTVTVSMRPAPMKRVIPPARFGGLWRYFAKTHQKRHAENLKKPDPPGRREFNEIDKSFTRLISVIKVRYWMYGLVFGWF